MTEMEQLRDENKEGFNKVLKRIKDLDERIGIIEDALKEPGEVNLKKYSFNFHLKKLLICKSIIPERDRKPWTLPRDTGGIPLKPTDYQPLTRDENGIALPPEE